MADELVQFLKTIFIQQQVDAFAGRKLAGFVFLLAPLKAAADAVVLDTTRLSLEQQVQAVVALARARLPG